MDSFLEGVQPRDAFFDSTPDGYIHLFSKVPSVFQGLRAFGVRDLYLGGLGPKPLRRARYGSFPNLGYLVGGAFMMFLYVWGVCFGRVNTLSVLCKDDKCFGCFLQICKCSCCLPAFLVAKCGHWRALPRIPDSIPNTTLLLLVRVLGLCPLRLPLQPTPVVVPT